MTDRPRARRPKRRKRFLSPETVERWVKKLFCGQPICVVWYDVGKEFEEDEDHEKHLLMTVYAEAGVFWKYENEVILIRPMYDLTERATEGKIQAISIQTIYKLYTLADDEIMAFADPRYT